MSAAVLDTKLITRAAEAARAAARAVLEDVFAELRSTQPELAGAALQGAEEAALGEAYVTASAVTMWRMPHNEFVAEVNARCDLMANGLVAMCVERAEAARAMQ